MGLDAGIFNALGARPKSVADYAAEYDQADARKQSLAQNALAMQTAQMGLAEKQRAVQEQNALRNYLGGGADLGTPQGQAGLYSAAPGLAGGVLKDYSARKQAESQTRGHDAETMTKHLNIIKSLTGQVMANPTPQAATAALDMAERLTGVKMDEDRAQLAQMQTPDQIKAWAAGHSVAADKLLPHFQTRNTGGTTDTLAIDPLTGKATVANSVKNTASPDAVMHDATTRHGQNLADARARDLAQITRDAAEERKVAAADEKKTAVNDKAVTKFSDTLQKEGIPELETALAGAEGVFRRYQKPGPGGKPVQGDVPGIGPLKNILPAGMMSDEGKDVRQALAAVRNIVLNARSGAAVTDQELRRLVEEIGTGAGMSQDDILRGLTKIRTRFEAIKSNAAAGVSDEVKSAYEDRGGIKITRGGAKPPANDIHAQADAILRGGK